MSNLVKYGSYELEAAEDEKANLDVGSSSFMKLKEGRNVVRVLPPPIGQKTPFTKVHQHFIDMPGGASVRFNCPKHNVKQFCPVCPKADKLIASTDEDERKRGFAIRAKRRIFVNVLDRNDEDAGVQILGMGKTIYEALVKLRADEDAGGDFSHPVDGFDVVIERKGTGFNTEYTVRPSRKESELGNMELIATQPTHGHLATIPSLEQIKEMFNAGKAQPEPTPEDFSDVVDI